MVARLKADDDDNDDAAFVNVNTSDGDEQQHNRIRIRVKGADDFFDWEQRNQSIIIFGFYK